MKKFDKERFERINSFRRWLKDQPAGKKVDIMDNHNCIFAQWAKECGAENVTMGVAYYYLPKIGSIVGETLAPVWQQKISCRLFGFDTITTISQIRKIAKNIS